MNNPEDSHLSNDESQLGSHPDREKNSQKAPENASYLPDETSISSFDIQLRLKEAEQNLKNEKKCRKEEIILHERAMKYLQAKLKDSEENLMMERSMHEQTKLDLIEKRNEANHQRQFALDAVGELNRFLRGNKVPNQSTDDEIIQKAMTLRVGIRDFAIFHFGGNLDQVRINQASLESLNQFLRIPPDYLETYASASSTRINLIRAFLWAYLRERVFNQFCWTWQGASTAFRDISSFLDTLISRKESRDSQGERKFHTWRANTASLLVEAMSLDEGNANSDCEQLIQKWSNHISQLLEPFRLSHHSDYRQELEGILSQSVELDKEICKQIASFEWLAHEHLPCTFVPEAMELEPSQEHHGNNGIVTFVLGPGLVKHGKSSGDRFDMMERLLKTQVFCDRPPR
ncbi:hypothetical protein F5Y12DRAFT_749255 [Xylaria sp. FL1777]|nr:hypothetical protein F5Y12DRAFT_749255 [Xylaria sp. FL1777]